MGEPFIFINTYAIEPDRRDEYLERFRRTAQMVQANNPRVLYFACHLSEDGSRASTVQVHADADSMALHMQQAARHIEAAREILDFSTMSMQILGSPTEAVLEGIRRTSAPGATVTVMPAAVAFDRFPEV
ncbi:MAG TPA: hypothetical protein VHF25_13085 [Nitriliruptorales bacterium]|nr:hypothetical protein [Nitriliruptorales bacterium]